MMGCRLRAVATYRDEQEQGADRMAGETAATTDGGVNSATANAVLAVPTDSDDNPNNQGPTIAPMTREWTVPENDDSTDNWYRCCGD